MKGRQCGHCGAHLVPATSLRIKLLTRPALAGPLGRLWATLRLLVARPHYLCRNHSAEEMVALLRAKAGRR